MTSPTRGQRSYNPHDTTKDTIWEENETSPLLPSSTNDNASDASDPISLYVKILAENLPWYKRPSVLWLIPIYGLTSMSGGMLFSSLGQFQAELLCREYMNRHEPANATATLITNTASFLLNAAVDISLRPAPGCNAPEIQAYTAKIVALMEVLGGIAATLSIGYYASLSDKYGRIKIMCVGILNSLSMLISIIIMRKWWDQVGLPFMAFATLVHGLLGGIGIGGTMSLAYAADCTEPSRRSLVFSWLHAALFMGLSIGPFLGGLIVKLTGSILLVVYTDIGVTILALLGLFITPESLPGKQSAHIQELYEQALKSNNQESPTKKSSLSSAAATAWHYHMIRSLQFFKPNGQNTNMILVGAISFLQMLALKGTFSILILYTNRAFNWTEYEDGILLSLSSSVRFFSLLVLLPILVHTYHKRTSKREAKTSKSATTTNTAKGKNNSNSNNNNINDNSDRIIANHPEQILGGGLDDPVVASRVEHLGEAALNLSDDEESFQERRRRQSTADSAITLTPNRMRRPSSSYSSPSSPSTLRKASLSSSTRPSSGITINNNSKANKANSSEEQGQQQSRKGDIKLDTWIVRLGFVINSTTYAGYGLATKGWHFYLWASLHAISIIASPSLKTILTNLVEPSQFGAALGAIQVVDSIAGIASPVVISGVYALTVGTWPEFVWYCCALLTGLCVILAFMIRPRQSNRTSQA
ncbi:hypothetical protein BX616_004346 [Lobosporangium transversale]|uniref:Major facilitator superfamily-domain-containing protein n=1 Tax=Lobosporangium transversale TaxID=64571 RepID=A0A1Y2GT59_9FUNG|nr:major facilitator superfamily-domain-containing protein [Lobosporangium transversale]KAF9916210.1 hypothetical protein BX616_004346 [Lobosporangium transversale]ORZ20168.1 major facilitator superfamily-domain-containing protein [Lobosporangium transversale]|eukprot:XP_021882708.1 major facilitator superfamily-domain-containing protein [Lobosporangium transversale]